MGGQLSSPRLAGRAGELARILGAFEEVRGGARRALLVSGEAGIGKSRLLAETARALGGRATFLTGTCAPLGEAALPYAPILEALRDPRRGRSRASLLDQIEIGQSGGDGRHQRARIFAELLDRLEQRAGRRTAVLLVEDVHWAGDSTIALISYLLRNQPARLLPIITYRSGEVAPMLARLLPELARMRSVETVELQPLAEAEMRQMMASVLGAPPNAVLLRDIHSRSGGNPFLAEELIAAVQRGEPVGLSERLRDILAIRLLDLPADSLLAIRAAAVLGIRAPIALVRETGRLNSERLDDAISLLAERQLLLPDESAGTTIRFRHDLMREAVYESIPPGERDELHHRAAEALAARLALTPGAPTNGEIAQHLLAGGRDAEAVPYLERAGDDARRVFAFSEALGWYRRALDSLDDTGSGTERLSLLERMAEAAALNGDGQESEASAREATRLLDAAGETVEAYRLRARRAHWLWMTGQEEIARALWEELRDADLPPEVAELPEVLAVQARLADRDRDRCEHLARAAVALARAQRRPDIEAEALVWVGMSTAQTGREQEGIAALRRAARIFAEQHDVAQYWYASHLLVAILGEAEQPEEAAEAGEDQRRTLIALGVEPKTREGFLSNLRDVLWSIGRWDQVMREVDSALELGVNDNAACDLLQLRAAILISRGDLQAAERDVSEAAARGYGKVQESYLGALSLLRARLAFEANNLDAASAEVRRGITAVLGTNDVREDMLHDLVLMGMRIEADRASQRRSARWHGAGQTPEERAAELLCQLRARRAWRDPRYTLFRGQVATSWLQARAEARRLRGHPAPELWGGAASGWAELRRPEPEAYARLRLGESLLADPATRASGSAELGRASKLAIGLGAVTLQRAVEAAAEEAGVAEVMARSTDQEIASYHLTPREREVLKLLPLGWSNKEVANSLGISEKTVEIYVSNILRKLGVDGRVAAALLAVRLGLTPLDRSVA